MPILRCVRSPGAAGRAVTPIACAETCIEGTLRSIFFVLQCVDAAVLTFAADNVVLPTANYSHMNYLLSGC